MIRLVCGCAVVGRASEHTLRLNRLCRVEQRLVSARSFARRNPLPSLKRHLLDPNHAPDGQDRLSRHAVSPCEHGFDACKSILSGEGLGERAVRHAHACKARRSRFVIGAVQHVFWIKSESIASEKPLTVLEARVTLKTLSKIGRCTLAIHPRVDFKPCASSL